jgi:hypothetical protein
MGILNITSILLIIMVLVSVSSSQDAQSYIKGKCDHCSELGIYSTADECYAYALTYPQDGPVFSRIWVIPQYGYFLYANEEYNNSKIFERILSEPLSESENVPSPELKDILFRFSITNPNDMQMKIEEIYIEVLEYYPIENVRFAPISIGGDILEYFCNIKSSCGLYKCMPLFKDPDYVKLNHGELESFNISINTVHPGVYRLGICVEYTIGGMSRKIDVRNPIPDCVSFIDGQPEDYISDGFMPNNMKDNRMNVLVGFFDKNE